MICEKKPFYKYLCIAVKFFVVLSVFSCSIIICSAVDNINCTHDCAAYLKDIIEPTCTQDGVSCWICTNCEQQVGDSWAQPATGHRFDSWYTINEATCTKDGVKERVCMDCGESETTVYQTAYGHDFSSNYTVDVSPTCTSEGQKSYHCLSRNCDAKTGVTTIEKADHSFGAWKTLVAATTESTGAQEHVCMNCGFSETSIIEQIPTSGCSFELDVPDTANIGETFDVILSYDALKIIGYGQVFIEYDANKLELVTYEWLLPDKWFDDNGESDFILAVNGDYNKNGKQGTFLSFMYVNSHEVDSTEIIKLTYRALETGTINFNINYDEWSNAEKPLPGTASMVVTEQENDSNDFNDSVMIGDVNMDGKVTAADARLALRYAAGLYIESFVYTAMDANGDGKISAADARLILRVAAGLDEFEESNNKTENKDDPNKQIKDNVLSSASNFASNKDYKNAIITVEQGIKTIGNDTDLINLLNEYKTLFVTNICVQVDVLISEKNYSEAVILLNNALIVVPENSVLTEKLEEVNESQSTYLVDILDPYESNDFEEFSNGHSVMMGGTSRYNGFTLNVYGWNGQSCAVYNLNSKYSKLTGIVGYVDNKTGDGKTWNAEIYADGVLVYTCTVSPGDLPQEFSVNVTGVKKLEFRAGSNNGFSGYIGFAEIELDGANSDNMGSESKPIQGTAYLVDVLDPYESNDFEEFSNGHSVMMGGTSQYNGFTLNVYGWNGQSCAVYNLNSNYGKLTGITGYVDNKIGDGKTWDVEIYADGILVYTCTVSPGDLPQEFSVDVTGVKKLEFRAGSTNGFSGYIGFADITIS